MPHDDGSDDTLDRLEHAEQLKLQGDHVAALMILEELLLEDPSNVSALEEIADNELSLGRHARAEAAAAEAVRLDRESYTGYYILGFLRSREEHWRESTRQLKTANALKPNNSEILRCLGWSLFNAGKRAQGVVTLERSLNIDKDSVLTLCDLGVAYLQVRHFSKAIMLFRRALDLEPENRRAKECLQTTEHLMSLAEPRRREKAKQAVS